VAKNLEKLLRILQNVIEKSFINWRVLPLVKINTRISDISYLFVIKIHILKNRKKNVMHQAPALQLLNLVT
jgi:hypothetical protein